MNYKYLFAEGTYENCNDLANLLLTRKKELGIKDIMMLNTLDKTDDRSNFQIVIKHKETVMFS